MSPSTPTPSSTGRTLADLIFSTADTQTILEWAATAQLGEVFIDGELLEPIPVAEVSDSDFAAFEEALS